MQLRATYQFDAPPERVWDLLMNTEAIASCLPGCQGLQPIGEDRYEVQLNVAVSTVSGNFKGTVELQDKMPPQSYTLIVDSSGRPGFIRGRSQITLEPSGDRTLVHVAAEADAGGTVARFGQRLLEGVGRTMMDRFFRCMAGRVQG